MRLFLITMLTLAMIITALSAAADPDLGSRSPFDKASLPRVWNPGTPDGRQGGETMADAFPIPDFPFEDTGNTSDNMDDYDAVCPYSGSTAPDVVYAFPPLTGDTYVSVDMCGSGYDTKIYILNADGEVVACNDDYYYSDPECGTYVSLIEQATLPYGSEYYLVIDGYGDTAGDYILTVQELEAPEPCVLDCNGFEEGEPPLQDGYVDLWNSGCNDETGLEPFWYLTSGYCGPSYDNVCGVSGWFDDGHRDTDWYIAEIGETGILEWTLDAEQETYGFLLGGDLNHCVDVTVDEQMLAGPCNPAQMTIQTNPHETVFLWVGPTEYYPPAGFTGHEYQYVMEFEGLMLHPGVTATETINLDMIKTLYR